MISFLANPTGTFTDGTTSWNSSTFGYFANAYPQAGDFNGDGKDDVAGMYGYADGSVTMLTWTTSSDGSGTLGSGTAGWSAAPNNWTFSRVHYFDTHS
jgi:hypothetical protein